MERHVQMRKPYQSPGRMKNSSYYIELTTHGDWTHDLPHTIASNMVKVSHALNHLALEAVNAQRTEENRRYTKLWHDMTRPWI